MVAVTYGVMFAMVGGFVAARLAPSRPLLHAGGLGVMVALAASVSLVASASAEATWSQWSALALVAPSACLDGWLAARLAKEGAAGSG